MKKLIKRICMIAIAAITVLGCNAQSGNKNKEWEGYYSWTDAEHHVYHYWFEIKHDDGSNCSGKMCEELAKASSDYTIVGQIKGDSMVLKQTEGFSCGANYDMDKDEFVSYRDPIDKSLLETYVITKRNGKYYCILEDGASEKKERELEFNPYDISAKERVESIYKEMIELYKQSDDGFADLSKFNTRDFLSEEYMALWQKAEAKYSSEGNEMGYFDYDHWGSMQDPGSGLVEVNVRPWLIKKISDTKEEINVSLTFGREEKGGIIPERSQDLTLIIVKERDGWFIDNFIIDDINEKANMEKYLK